MGYFYWLRVKNSNHLPTELSLDYMKDTKLYLESKASYIHVSSVASFKPFLIALMREYCTFSDSYVVSLKSSRWSKYTQYGTILQKKNHVLLSKIFSSSNMLFIRLFLANTRTKNRGSLSSFNRKRSTYFAIELSLREIALPRRTRQSGKAIVSVCPPLN